MKKACPIGGKIFWQFNVLPCNLPQAKGDLKSNIINFVYKLPYELPKSLRVRILRYLDAK